MIHLNNQSMRFFHSFNKNFYDIICIGNKAQKVAKLVEQRNKKISLRKLFVKSSDNEYEASLAILGKSSIEMSKKVDERIDTKLRNQILGVDPNKNILFLRSGEQLRFRHLIFSGDDQEWKDRDSINGLNQAISTNYTSTYADIQGSNVQQLYNMVNTDIYFNISSDRHFGIDNYFMLHLADSLRNISLQYGYDAKSTKIKILNKGRKLVAFNDEVEKIIRQLLQQRNVEVMEDSIVSQINHRKRQITVMNNGFQKTLSYGGFYQYLPFKIPQFLANSQIDPLNVDSRTLINKDYPHIHVVGNIVPTVFSFYGFNYMAHTIAQNIINMELRSNELAVYEGDTVFPFWTGVNNLRYFKFNYEKTTFFNNIGSEKWSSILLGLDRKLMAKKEIQMYYPGKSCGMPYYIANPKLQCTSKKSNKDLKKECLSL